MFLTLYENIIQWDTQLFLLINELKLGSFVETTLVMFRNRLIWLPVYIFILLFIYYNFSSSRWWIYLGVTICIFLSDTSSSKLIKPSVQRMRPCNVENIQSISRIPCSNGYSFTSSHATNHFAMSTFLYLLMPFWRYRWLFYLWAGIIAFAQVYVGVHFPSDVLVGTMLGMLLGFLSFKIYSFLVRKFQTLNY